MRSVVVRGAVAWATLSSSSSSSWGVVAHASYVVGRTLSSSSWLVRRGRPTFRRDVVLSLPRGGESLADEHDDDDEYDEEDEEDEEEDEEDEGVVVEEKDDDGEESYDEMLVPSPMSSMGVTVGVMMFTKRLDLTDSKVIRRVRAAYVAYVIVCQVFYAYARLAARAVDDRSRVTVSNPLTELVRDKLGDASSSSPTTAAAKSVADRLLRSETTVVEYDVGKARRSSAGMLTGLAFTWFLHFKMNQVQPLLFQTASGLLNLYFDPLFQIYARGRRLRRPFAAPPSPFAPPPTTETGRSTDADKDEEDEDEDEEGTMKEDEEKDEEEEEEETDDETEEEEEEEEETDEEEEEEEVEEEDEDEDDDDDEDDDEEESDEDDETDDDDDED